MTDPLTDAIYAALRPRGLRERAQLLLTGGLTPLQLLGRLPPELATSLSKNPNETLARREAIAAITLALDGLVVARLVRRERLQLKSALVDVYRRT